jgi:hypothetical protein
MKQEIHAKPQALLFPGPVWLSRVAIFHAIVQVLV